jgi:hypothetical protein
MGNFWLLFKNGQFWATLKKLGIFQIFWSPWSAGATTAHTELGIMTFSMMTISTKALYVTLSIRDNQHK